MQVITTVTQKGQVTLPKIIREMFGVKEYDKVLVEPGVDYIKIKPTEDIIDLAGKYKSNKNKSVLKARKFIEKHYRRI